MPDLSSAGGDPASSTAPPGPEPGAVSSGGAGAPGGMLPPTGQGGAVDGQVPPQGLVAMGMEIMRKAMGAIHLGRSLLDPFSEEGKAADTMFRHGAKHFKPDHDAAKALQGAPQMAGPQGGGPPGGAPQMAGGQPGPPSPPSGPIPRMAAQGA